MTFLLVRSTIVVNSIGEAGLRHQESPSLSVKQSSLPATRRGQSNACRPRRLRTAVAVPAQYRNRPTAIRVAIYRVWQLADSLGLTRATTAVLQAILACGVVVDSPFEPVFARRATLARLAGCSEASIYRALQSLADKGLIDRAKQVRLADGMMDLGMLSITPTLATLIGLTETQQPVPETGPKTVKNGAPNDSMQPQMKADLRGGSIYKEEHGVDLRSSVNHQSAVKGSVRMDGRSVPQDLAWLITENRVTYGQLFKLMSQANKVQGQKLSDFVLLRKTRIEELNTTNDVYRYLKSLIDQGIDARYLNTLQAKRIHQTHRRSQRDALLRQRETWLRSIHGKTFLDKATNHTYTVDADKHLLHVALAGSPTVFPSIRLSKRFIRAVEAGVLVAYAPSMPPRSEKGLAALQDMMKLLKPRASLCFSAANAT